MTAYNPFGYGNVNLGKKQAAEGGEPDHEDMLFADGDPAAVAGGASTPKESSWAAAMPTGEQDISDLLPASARQASPSPSPSAPAGERASDGRMPSPGVTQFGMEVLGEESEDSIYGNAGAPAAGADAAGSPSFDSNRAAPVEFGGAELVDEDGRGEEEESVQEPMARRRGQRTVHRQPLATAAAVAAAADAGETGAVRVRRSASPRRRKGGPRIAAVLVPALFCAAGGTSGAWFWVMQDNPVMAGLIGAGSLVAAVFSWLLLRG
ncbi:MAG: hypothetical protein AB8H80_12580 [Planctomycetota bacterium]